MAERFCNSRLQLSNFMILGINGVFDDLKSIYTIKNQDSNTHATRILLKKHNMKDCNDFLLFENFSNEVLDDFECISTIKKHDSNTPAAKFY